MPSRKLLLTLLFAQLALFALARDLHIAVAGIDANLEPGIATSNTGMQIVPNLFETLIEMDMQDNSVLKPKLATSWHRVDDLTLELTLREGVTFHNGDPFGAEDVKFSFERFMNPDYRGSLSRSLFATITAVDIVDDHTVRISTAQPDPILEYRLASLWGAWIVPAKHYQAVGADAFGIEPVGTGFYRLSDRQPDRIELTAFAGYWGARPAAERVVYRIIPEVSTRVAALIAGEVDIVAALPADQYASVERNADLRVERTLINNIHMLVYNTWDSPITDPKLRQALNLGIDRQLIVDALWHGDAEVPRSHQFAAYGPLFNAERQVQPYDPDRARQLIAESGYDGSPVYYLARHTGYVNELPVAEIIVQMWQDLGIDAHVSVVDPSQLDLNTASVGTWSNTMRFPDPAGGLWLLWNETGTQQIRGWTPRNGFNEVGHELEIAQGIQERFELSQRLLDLWEEEAPGTVLWFPSEAFGVSNTVVWKPNALQTIDLRAELLSFID
ncbi:MAG TPA: ABC transporter substrate-binding protein [Trueperaceae bacterium]|nr:ABC transporter substrate-binding protein [Trueperaceae bacterium]